MKLPELSHLQFVVIDSLGSVELSGRELRAALAQSGMKKSGPAFYQMMGRMEESHFIKRRVLSKNVEGEEVKETRYKITGHGASSYNAALHFYQNRHVRDWGGASYA